MNSNNINEHEFSNFSQNGEDGIIEFLSSKISNNDKYFVEIGCGNGLENNSTNLVLIIGQVLFVISLLIFIYIKG